MVERCGKIEIVEVIKRGCEKRGGGKGIKFD